MPEWVKAIISLALFEAAISGENCPPWARAIGWALILSAFVAHGE